MKFVKISVKKTDRYMFRNYKLGLGLSKKKEGAHAFFYIKLEEYKK